MLKRRAEAAGITYWNPHAYRHTMAMKLLNDGEVELGIVSKILGHSSPEITRRIYADFVDSSVKRAFSAAADRLNGSL
jgi:integrase